MCRQEAPRACALLCQSVSASLSSAPRIAQCGRQQAHLVGSRTRWSKAPVTTRLVEVPAAQRWRQVGRAWVHASQESQRRGSVHAPAVHRWRPTTRCSQQASHAALEAPLPPCPSHAALTNGGVQASQKAAVGEGDEQLADGQPRLAGPRQHDGQLQTRDQLRPGLRRAGLPRCTLHQLPSNATPTEQTKTILLGS